VILRVFLFIAVVLPLSLPFAWPPIVEAPREFLSYALFFASFSIGVIGNGQRNLPRILGAKNNLGVAALPIVIWLTSIGVQSAIGQYLHWAAWFPSALLAGAMLAMCWAVAAIRARENGAETCLQMLTTAVHGIFWSGLINALICMLQTNNILFEQFTLYERATGALLQPNHAALLMCFSIIAISSRMVRLPWIFKLVSVALLAYGIYTTRSRFGIGIGSALLIALPTMAVLNRVTRFRATTLKLENQAKNTSRMFFVFFFLASFAAASFLLYRYCEHADLVRYHVERDSLNLLLQQPFFGVGVGQVRLSWLLAELPDKSNVVFDNAHNSLLNAALSVGIPLAVLCAVSLGMALHRAIPFFCKFPAIGGILIVAFAHSLLEHSSTYAYLVLPVFFLLCCAISLAESTDKSAHTDSSNGNSTRQNVNRNLSINLGALMFVMLTICSLYAGWSYFQTFVAARVEGVAAMLFPVANYPSLISVRRIEKDPNAFHSTLVVRADAPLLERYALALHSKKCVQHASTVMQRVKKDWPDFAQSSQLLAPCRAGSIEYFSCKSIETRDSFEVKQLLSCK
jgi:hypothetical protein